ncbi:hypothetical protein GCM10027176_01230 [Actinoallomurus bryophytorum]|uniref:Uncharacterized protein n=1 Tax=Actinoallomurus bryophytorum TaxID=1490222 RepID=A0A543CEC9_9ACTN|nr:hypothetical protein [Actinoallomurus bryophytorum]TQL95453.1 hypothetical protein FB559_0956 [Actinoallomurus bryophytorum]
MRTLVVPPSARSLLPLRGKRRMPRARSSFVRIISARVVSLSGAESAFHRVTPHATMMVAAGPVVAPATCG